MLKQRTETRKRSFAKAMTWRISGVIILGIIAWIYTKNIELTATITLIFHSIRFFLYYAHERLWLRVKWGINYLTS